MAHNSFLKYLEFEKRYSIHTISAYDQDLKQFSAYLEEEYELGQPVSTEFFQVRSWIVHLMHNGVSPRSVNRKLSTLKSYFKYLQRKGLITKNPMLKVIPPKPGKKLPAFLTAKHTNFLFEEIDFGEGFSGLRNKLMLEVLYATGMRRAELMSLVTPNVDLAAGKLKVIGKGNKERIIPFGKSLNQLLAQYLESRKDEFPANKHNELFLTDKGLPLYPKFVYNTVKRYLSQVTTADKRSPHVLRHTFATHLTDEGANLNAVKELLGHSSLAATQIYTHNTIEKLKKAYNQAHPKA